MYWSSNASARPLTVGPRTASTTSSSMAASSARAPGKKRVTPPKPCSDGVGARRPQRERAARPGGAIEALAVGAAAGDRPHRVAQVLLHERDLRLHGELDVGQRLAAASVGRDAGQHPGRALLHHQAARAVDRVDDDDDLDVLLRACRRAARGARPAPALRPPAGTATAATAPRSARAAPARTVDRRRTRVSPASSPTTADSSSIDWRSHAATTSSRMASCTARMRATSASASRRPVMRRL